VSDRIYTAVNQILLVGAAALPCTASSSGPPPIGPVGSDDGVACELARLRASGAFAGDQMGFSVAISGDRVVAGAAYEGHSGFDLAGAAYIFERDSAAGGAWVEVARLTSPAPGEGELFGFAVALSGDTVVVGCPIAPAAGLFAGAVSAHLIHASAHASA
jgi:hypothetical protein